MELNNLQLLLVEDDIDLATAIIDYFELDNIQCDHAANGISGLSLIKKNNYDAIILDLNLPKMNGLSVCEHMRSQGIDTPVLMLTAQNTLRDKLAGFAKGADDYLIKPFAMQELIVRIQVLAQRRSGQVSKIKVDNLELNIEQGTVERDSRRLKLSPIGYKILEALMRASPSPLSREKLIQRVWGDGAPDCNSLKVHMFNLRKVVDGNGNNKLIHTLIGRGFVLKRYVNS